MTTKQPFAHETDQLEHMLANTEDAIARVDIYNELADRIYARDPEQAIRLLDEAAAIAIANQYGGGFVNSQMKQVHIRNLNGDMQLAFAQINQLLSQDQITLTEQQKLRIKRKLATFYAELGDYVRALSTLHEILRQEVAWGNQEGQAHAHLKIGNLYSISADSAQALDHYQASIDIFNALGDIFYVAIVHNSYCVDYAKLGHYEQAESHGHLARDLFSKIDDKYGMALIESSLGELAIARQKFGIAVDHFARAFSIFGEGFKSDNAAEMHETRLNLGHALKATGNLAEAQAQAEAVLQHAQVADLRPLARQAHALLAQIHEAASRPWDALHHLKQYVRLNEAILGENARREIQNLKVIHETEQAQAELEQQQRLREQDRIHFEQLSRIKDEFVHNVTHDIKNPLSIIETSMYMLKERFLGQEPAAQRILDTISRQLTKILTLVEEMLELAKLEAVPNIQREEIPLDPWLTQLIEAVRPLAESKQIDLVMRVGPADLTFHGDQQRLGQALDNLLVNAIKYTLPAGQICLQARQLDQQLEIRIQDTGIGIPPEALPHVFDRFYRVQAHAEENEGSGLGLHVVKIAVEQHGGTINVTSEVHQGTTFTILLPLFLRAG